MAQAGYDMNGFKSLSDIDGQRLMISVVSFVSGIAFIGWSLYEFQREPPYEGVPWILLIAGILGLITGVWYLRPAKEPKPLEFPPGAQGSNERARRFQELSSSSDDGTAILAIVLLLSSFGIVGWQIFDFLRDGEWVSISIITALVKFDIPWAIYPQDWLGLHKVLDVIPLSAALFVSGLIALSEA